MMDPELLRGIGPPSHRRLTVPLGKGTCVLPEITGARSAVGGFTFAMVAGKRGGMTAHGIEPP